MKKNIPLAFLFLSVFNSAFSQNSEALRKQAMQLFDEGKFTESLASFEKIRDKKTLENTNVNLYKANLEDIINYRFFNKTKLNDTLYKVYIKTSIIKSQGIYNVKSNKYTVPPIYDSIPVPEYYTKYRTVYKDNLTTLLNIETGKIIVPSGDFFSLNAGYVLVYPNRKDDDFTNDDIVNVFDLNGNLLFKDFNTFGKIGSFIRTKNKNNKYQLINLDTKKVILDDCDYFENPTSAIVENDSLYDNVWLPFHKENKNYLYKITKNGIEDTHKFDTFIPMYTNYNYFDNSISKIINFKDNATSCPIDENRICFFSYYTIVKKDNKYGIFNVSKDKYYKEPIYDSISNLGNTFYKGKWINLVYDEEICMPFTGRDIQALIFKKNDLFGLIDLRGKVIAEANYDEIVYGWNGIYCLRKGVKWGFVGVQKEDKLVVPEFDLITYLGNNGNLAAHKNKKTIEYLRNGTRVKPSIQKNNQMGKIYIEPNNSFFVDNSEIEKSDRLIFKKEEKYGLDDLNNNEIIPAKYSSIQYARKNTFIVQTDSLQGLIDYNGKELIPIKYNGIEYKSYDSDLLFVKFNQGLQSIFNVEGKMIYPPKIQQVKGVHLDNKANITYIYVTELSHTIIEKSTNNQEKFYKNFVLKVQDGKVEKLKIEADSYEFLNNNILVYGGGWRVGFYNLSNGKKINREFDYKYINDYYPHKRIIAKKGEYYDTLIDSLCNVSALDHPFFEVANGYYFFKEGNKVGVMDKNLKTTNFKYPVLRIMEDVDHTYASQVYVEKARSYFQFNTKIDSQKNGLINFDGKIIIQPEIYDSVGLFHFEKNNTGYDHYPDTGHSTKYPNPYLNKYDNVFYGINNQFDSRIVNLITAENGKIAEFKVGKYERWNFSTYNNVVIIKSKDSVKLYDVSSKKIVLKIKANVVDENNDFGYTISNFDNKSSKNKYEKYDCNGKFIMDTLVDSGKRYYSSDENYIRIKNNKYGTLNSKGKQGIPFVYDHLLSKNSKIFICKNNNVYGVIDAENQTLIDKKYQDIQWAQSKERYNRQIDFSGLMLKEKNKWGLINLNLKKLLPIEFDNIQVQENCITAKKDSLVSAFDFRGKMLFTAAVDSIKTDLNNNCHFYKNGEEVFRDKNGVIVDEKPNMSWEDQTKAKYSKKIETKYYLSKNDCIIYKTPIVTVESIEVAENFMGEDLEYLLIKDENKLYGLYTQDLKQIFPFVYNEIIVNKNEDFVIVNKNNKYGVINLKNEILIPFEYDKIQFNNRRFFNCTKNGKDYNITPQNKIIYLEKSKNIIIKKKSSSIN